MRPLTLLCRPVAVALLFLCFPQEMPAYDWPVEPGSTEWLQMSHSERLASLQIPGHILTTITTKELVRLYLEYPYVQMMRAAANFQLGFERIYREFNGVQELLNRPDAFEEIITVYHALVPSSYDPNWPMHSRHPVSFKLLFIEMLLAQETLLSKLTQPQIDQFLNEAVNKYQQKKADHHGVYDDHHLSWTVYPIGRLMRQLQQIAPAFKVVNQTPSHVRFLDTNQLEDSRVINDILEAAIRYNFRQ